jgi:hypothetical protein
MGEDTPLNKLALMVLPRTASDTMVCHMVIPCPPSRRFRRGVGSCAQHISPISTNLVRFLQTYLVQNLYLL